jgi:hypothetical protein
MAPITAWFTNSKQLYPVLTLFDAAAWTQTWARIGQTQNMGQGVVNAGIR